ncbi:MAG: flagellar biosynthesis protein FlhF [Deltaproteobacteria bacterium]|nr:flagellar biosynthesis protein FlhF [Deltaproteobacteria bacterium]
MKIKTFRARSFGEALALVKKEMGEDAVILSTEERKGLRPSVEVSAAVDYEIGEIRSGDIAFPLRAPSSPSAVHTAFPVPENEDLRNLRRSLVDAVKTEVGALREFIETSRAGRDEAATPAPAVKKDLLRFLAGRGIREEHARGLCAKAEGLKDLPGAVLAGVAVREGKPGAKKAVMLIGPTGVGKTTTIAKLAAAAIKAGKRAAVVSLDSYRIGAIEQIRIYARIMGIPLEVASDARQVKERVGRHADKDIVFIDTTGRNPMGEAFLAELAPVYEAGFPVESHLLVSATSDYEFLARAWKSYARLPVDCVGVTKVDEAARNGAIYNVAALCGKPIVYLTTGQSVPGDIVFPTREKIARMILTEGRAAAAPAVCA